MFFVLFCFLATTQEMPMQGIHGFDILIVEEIHLMVLLSSTTT